MTEVNLLDMSAIVAMESITETLAKQHVFLIINNLQERMALKLRRVGISDKPAKVQFSRTLEDAIVMANKLL
jgi:SulP family sulfate permease